MKTNFTKSDLKTGMRVTFRNGRRMIALIDGSCGVLASGSDGYSYMNLDSYSHQLMYSPEWCLPIVTTHNLDIMEVHSHPLTHSSVLDLSQTYNETLIWKREEKSEKEIQIEKLQATIALATKQIEELKGKL